MAAHPMTHAALARLAGMTRRERSLAEVIVRYERARRSYIRFAATSKMTPGEGANFREAERQLREIADDYADLFPPDETGDRT